ncbi:MAG: DUF6776 family protein [Lysobacter sp.]
MPVRPGAVGAGPGQVVPVAAEPGREPVADSELGRTALDRHESSLPEPEQSASGDIKPGRVGPDRFDSGHIEQEPPEPEQSGAKQAGSEPSDSGHFEPESSDSDYSEPSGGPPAGAAAPPAAPVPSSRVETHHHRWRLPAALLLAAALGFGAWGVWQSLTQPEDPPPPVTAGTATLTPRQLQAELEQLQQRVATLGRSDAISRQANRDLQSALAERDEEIAGLRADVAFYERLVGATGQRRGLTVHTLKMEQQDGAPSAWHFATTLTQNLNRGAVSAGRLSLALEGTRAGKLEKLNWADLRQQPEAPGTAYSFKYFQQVEGDVFLPAGLTPVRVTVKLTPQSGPAVEQSFSWADATEGSAEAGG